MKRLLLLIAVIAIPLLFSGISYADQQACARAVSQVERASGVPPHLMQAIALAESGRWDDAKRASFAWPWTINAEGQGRFFETKEAAVAEVQRLKARGVRSIDIGCMQVNLLHHPDAFATLDEAFDPVKNATYAGRFLRELHEAQGSWTAAVAHYHSATPHLHEPYRKRVLALWNEAQAKATSPGAIASAAAAAPAIPRALLPHTGRNNWIVMRGRILQVQAVSRR